MTTRATEISIGQRTMHSGLPAGAAVEAALKEAYDDYRRSGRLPEELQLEDLGYHLVQASRFGEAAWCFDHSEPTNPDRVELVQWWQMVVAHVRGRDEEASRAFRRFAAMVPASSRLPSIIRSMAFLVGDLEWASVWLRRGSVLSPEESESFSRLSRHADALYRSARPVGEASTRRATLLVLGQSNAGNSSEVATSVAGNARVFKSGRFYSTADPLVGAEGAGGSIWSRLATRLLASGFCEEIILVCVTRGSSTMEDWSTPGTFGLERTCHQLRASGVDVTHVLWQQGEQETVRGVSKEDYLRGLYRLRERLAAEGLSAPFYCALSTRVGARTCQEVAAAIGEAAAAGDGFRIGPDTDALGAEFRKDGTHLNAKGQDSAAELWLQTLLGSP